MNPIKNNNGFTLIEVMIVIVLLSALIATTISSINMTSSLVQNNSSSIMSAMSEIETSYGMYLNDKNTSPTGLTDVTFVPIYLMTPNTIQNFDSAYGTNGYVLAQQTGQAVGNNGWYIAARANVGGSKDIAWQGIVQAATKLSLYKFFYNTAVAAVTNMAPPAGASTVYVTYWITRY